VPWLLLLAARHADECGDVDAALNLVEQALAHTPTVIDLLLAKARLLKHAGRLADAADTLEYARTLDLADRYLNTKAVRYALRVNRVAHAERTVALFARHDAKDPAADPLGNLNELQVLWFEAEAAAACERVGDFGPALKRYLRVVDKHFADFDEDQFDFHMYCLRKTTLCAYVDLLLVEEKLRSHARFLEAAAGAARCYFSLHADPSLRRAAAPGAGNGGKDGAAAPAVAAAPPAAVPVDDEGRRIEKDDDPQGAKLLLVDAPLEQAAKYARLLTDNLPPRFRTAAAAVAVFSAGAGTPSSQAPLPTAARAGTPVLPATSSRLIRRAGWNTPADAAVSAHALAADIALARGKLLVAAAHVVAAQAAVSETPSAVGSGPIAAAAGLATQHAHPAALAAAVRLYRAVSGAQPEGAAATAVTQVVRLPDQCGSHSVDAFLQAAVAALGGASVSLATALVLLQLEGAGMLAQPLGHSRSVRIPAPRAGAAAPAEPTALRQLIAALDSAATARRSVPDVADAVSALAQCASSGWLADAQAARARAIAEASLHTATILRHVVS
jgi:hypothetical protein